MSESSDPMNLSPELALLADTLKSFKPAITALSRDRVLFEAGRASAAPNKSWLWRGGTAFFATVSLVLSGLLIFPERQPLTIVERVRFVEVSVPAPVDNPAPPPPLPSPAAVDVARANASLSPEVVRMVHIRNDVLRWGVDMLPRLKAPGNPAPLRSDADDLDRWLGAPAGTFTSPYPKSPRLFPNISGDS